MSAPSPLIDEWKTARSVLKEFDDRLHELRKYGFTLVTGLLAIQGFLLPFIPASLPANETTITLTYNTTMTEQLIAKENATKIGAVSTAPATNGLPYHIKIAILAVTAVLVIALRWLDGTYQGFQRGAALRGKVIERFLNMELTDQIAVRFEADRLRNQVRLMYYGFEVALIILAFLFLPIFEGGAIKSPTLDLPLTLFIVLLVSLIIEGIYYHYGVSPDSRRGPISSSEWAIDKLECKCGDQVRIMMTNVNTCADPERGIRHLLPNETIFDIVDDRGKSVFSDANPNPSKMVAHTDLRPGQSYVWMWNVHRDSGLYRIRVDTDTEGEKLLAQKRGWAKFKEEWMGQQKDIAFEQLNEQGDKLRGRELDRRIKVIPSKPDMPKIDTNFHFVVGGIDVSRV